MQRKQPNISKSDFSNPIVDLLQYINHDGFDEYPLPSIRFVECALIANTASFYPPWSAFHWPLYRIYGISQHALTWQSLSYILIPTVLLCLVAEDDYAIDIFSFGICALEVRIQLPWFINVLWTLCVAFRAAAVTVLPPHMQSWVMTTVKSHVAIELR